MGLALITTEVGPEIRRSMQMVAVFVVLTQPSVRSDHSKSKSDTIPFLYFVDTNEVLIKVHSSGSTRLVM